LRPIARIAWHATRIPWGGGMRGNTWTDDGVALLRKLWAEGATATAIGLRLGGLSRSAILGKVFRLRLNSQTGATAAPAVAVERPAAGAAAPIRRRGRQPRQRKAAPPERAAHQLTLLELKNENCRWPCGRPGRFLFCGVAEADLARGIPYCPHHMRRAYRGSVSFKKAERDDVVPSVNASTVGAAA
jgi:GcrA cell cycle regulator